MGIGFVFFLKPEISKSHCFWLPFVEVERRCGYWFCLFGSLKKVNRNIEAVNQHSNPCITTSCGRKHADTCFSSHTPVRTFGLPVRSFGSCSVPVRFGSVCGSRFGSRTFLKTGWICAQCKQQLSLDKFYNWSCEIAQPISLTLTLPGTSLQHPN